MFFGRNNELQKLNDLKYKQTASLVVIKGRRRIGKSTLIQKFGETFDLFCEIQGLRQEKRSLTGIRESILVNRSVRFLIFRP